LQEGVREERASKGRANSKLPAYLDAAAAIWEVSNRKFAEMVVTVLANLE
jgi:hypothetical protein